MKKEYTRFTIIGYFFVGLFSMALGFLYNYMPDVFESVSLSVTSIQSTRDVAIACVLAIIPTFCFYKLYFELHKGIRFLQPDHLIAIRSAINQLRYQKKLKSDEKLDHIDIDNAPLDEDLKQQIHTWFRTQEKCKFWAKSYVIVICFILVFLYFFFRTSIQLPNENKLFSGYLIFMACYSSLYIVVICFYTLLIHACYIESFRRLSYTIFFPTIVSVAVNMYFGLSANEIISMSKLRIIPILLFMAFFLFVSIFEILSYKLASGKSDKFSTLSFVWISIIILLFSIVPFVLVKDFTVRKPFSDLLFALSTALYLSIFEGWDALGKMKVDQNSKIFEKHYKWLNLFQIFYPLGVYLVYSMVNSEIFTYFFALTFSCLTFFSIRTWRKGGSSDYNTTNWSRRKMAYGLFIVGILLLNRMFLLGNLDTITEIPINGSSNTIEIINIVITVILVVAKAFVVKPTGIRDIIVMPFSEGINYSAITEYNKKGYIYSFSALMYLMYIIVIPVLLSKLLPMFFNDKRLFLSTYCILFLLYFNIIHGLSINIKPIIKQGRTVSS